MIQRTLHLPAVTKRSFKIDYWGMILLSAGVSLLLIWMSLGGSEFEWASLTSYLMVAGSVLLLAAFVLVELRAEEPLLNLTLFRN
ncbi:MFS transporter, partial [Salmonella enterica]|nr:MFS transporter [Salmonella enterica]